MKCAAIYARVSTTDRGQDPETQLRQLREYAERRGFPIASEFVDHASGAKNDRAQYRAMLDAARRREFDVLLVWRYDRFARSMRELVGIIAESAQNRPLRTVAYAYCQRSRFGNRVVQRQTPFLAVGGPSRAETAVCARL